MMVGGGRVGARDMVFLCHMQEEGGGGARPFSWPGGPPRRMPRKGIGASVSSVLPDKGVGVLNYLGEVAAGGKKEAGGNVHLHGAEGH